MAHTARHCRALASRFVRCLGGWFLQTSGLQNRAVCREGMGDGRWEMGASDPPFFSPFSPRSLPYITRPLNPHHQQRDRDAPSLPPPTAALQPGPSSTEGCAQEGGLEARHGPPNPLTLRTSSGVCPENTVSHDLHPRSTQSPLLCCSLSSSWPCPLLHLCVLWLFPRAAAAAAAAASPPAEARGRQGGSPALTPRAQRGFDGAVGLLLLPWLFVFVFADDDHHTRHPLSLALLFPRFSAQRGLPG